MTNRGWWVTTLLALGVALAPAPAPRAGTAAGAAPKPAAGSGRTPSGSRDRPMPDTVLALVADDREVTLSGFRSAWRTVEPPARPDSLTPHAARQFLDLLIEKEALGASALAESWAWTGRDSAEYLSLRDHLVMRVALDSALTRLRGELAARGDTASGPQALGMLARDSAAARLGARFVPEVTERLARAFAAIPRPAPESSLTAQLRMMGRMPEVGRDDLPRALVETREGPYTVAEALEAWRELNPIYRPRIERREQLEEVIRNQLFERSLRREARRRRIEDWPAIAAELAARREDIAVTHLVGRDVYGRIAMDSLTLLRHYRAHVHDWDLPLRVALTRLTLPSRQAAREMAVRLADPAQAESLTARARRSGVDYDLEISAATDAAGFARALRGGPGAVLGPDSTRGGWEVSRVRLIEPPRSRSFEECRLLVARGWYDLEGERLMRELMDRCRARTRVVVNERALKRLTSS